MAVLTALWVLLSTGRSFAQADEPRARDSFSAVEGKVPADKKSAPVALPESKRTHIKGIGDVKKKPAADCNSVFGGDGKPASMDGSCSIMFSGEKIPAATTAKPAAKGKIPELLEAVENRYLEGKTLVAKFTQVQTNALTKIKSTTAGVIQFKRPNKVYWDTTSPEDSKSLLVGNGSTYWFYRPPFDETEKGQVMIQKADQVQSKLAQILLSGAFSEAKGVKITEEKDNHFSLVFSGNTAGTAKSATITVDPEQKVVKQVVINNKDGNVSEISLTDIQVGEELRDELFQYQIPPGAEVIKR